MTDTPTPALRVARAYYDAWASGDLEQAMSYIADDVVCDLPGDHIEGAERFRALMAPFVASLVRCDLIAAFGDHNTALMMWQASTEQVKDELGAACLTIEDGKITQNRGVFDRVPFQAARGGVGS